MEVFLGRGDFLCHRRGLRVHMGVMGNERDSLEKDLGRGGEDGGLLRRYVEEGSGEAFGELVGRHIGAVYGHAERVMRDPGLAEDVTQAVFLLLAERAGSLCGNSKVPLVGWLYTVTHFTCANALRGERRRRMHEKEAGRMVALRGDVKKELEMEEHLDRVMQELGRKEREVILLKVCA